MPKKEQALSWLKWVVILFVLTYIPIWYNLDKPSIFIWDEASYANNALEMAMNGDFLVYKIDGEPSLYNLKPPLVIWTQSFFIWLFGPNELAIRFPSALAAFFTCLLVFWFAKKHSNVLTAFLSVLFLVTTQGYIGHHMTRTGDLDSMLVFFTTFYSLLYFDLLLKGGIEKVKKRFYQLGLLVFLAFMTKSSAGFMPLFGLFMASVFHKKGWRVFSNKHLYISALLSLSGCVLFYLIKGHYHPGFLEKVWKSEYLRISENIMPWLEGPYWYYFSVLHERLYKWYVYLLPLTFLLLKSKNEKARNFFKLGAVFCASYILLISYPPVKLDWYLGPVYPMLSLLLGFSFYKILNYILEKKSFFAKYKTHVTLAFFVLLFSFPYFKIYENNIKYHPRDLLERPGFALRRLNERYPEIKKFKAIFSVEYPRHIDAANFYIKKLNHYKGYNITLVKDIEEIQSGDTLLCSRWKDSQKLEKVFHMTPIIKVHESELLKIDSMKAE